MMLDTFFVVEWGSPDHGGGPRKVPRWRHAGQGAAARAVAVALLAGTAACATAGSGDRVVTRTRSDGEVVDCPKPPDEELDSEEATALSAAFSEIVQSLLSEGSAATKVEAILPAASTPGALDVLTYRVCLEYGEGVMTPDAYAAWTGTVLPALRRRVERGAGH